MGDDPGASHWDHWQNFLDRVCCRWWSILQPNYYYFRALATLRTGGIPRGEEIRLIDS